MEYDLRPVIFLGYVEPCSYMGGMHCEQHCIQLRTLMKTARLESICRCSMDNGFGEKVGPACLLGLVVVGEAYPTLVLRTTLFSLLL